MIFFDKNEESRKRKLFKKQQNPKWREKEKRKLEKRKEREIELEMQATYVWQTKIVIKNGASSIIDKAKDSADVHFGVKGDNTIHIRRFFENHETKYKDFLLKKIMYYPRQEKVDNKKRTAGTIAGIIAGSAINPVLGMVGGVAGANVGQKSANRSTAELMLYDIKKKKRDKNYY